MRERVGLIDLTQLLQVPGLRPWGGGVFSTRWWRTSCRRRSAASNLAHVLNKRGAVRTEFTIMRDGPESFYLVSSGAAERYGHDLPDQAHADRRQRDGGEHHHGATAPSCSPGPTPVTCWPS